MTIKTGNILRFNIKLEELGRRLYALFIRPLISKEIYQNRLKLIWFGWGYYPLFSISSLRFKDKMRILYRFLKIDWYILHGHKPYEIALVCRAIAERPAKPNEIILEAGCWHGGSSAKLSLIAKIYGYHLHIFDSFQGVEVMKPEQIIKSGHNFSGEYKSSVEILLNNLEKFGEVDICSIHAGWFADTLAKKPVSHEVRVAFIDCDLAKGTMEALMGIVPALAADGWIFTQDFHIRSVQALLSEPRTFSAFGQGLPAIKRLDRRLAAIRFHRKH